MLHTIFLAAFVPLATPSGQVEFELATDRSAVHTCQGPDGTWVRGASYKACAAASGFTFVPFLGSDAPRNWPVEFRVTAATVGGQALELTEEATVLHDSERFVLDRGAVRGIYAPTPSGVEQLFEVATGDLAGDLVLELAVRTDLILDETSAPVTYMGPRGGVSYGDAFALVPGPGTKPIEVAHGEGSIRMTVDSATVERSRGKVIIDPVISSATLASVVNTPRTHPDAAYDTTVGEALFAVTEVFSLTDRDCVLLRYNAANLTVETLYVNLSQDSWDRCQVATLHGSGHHLVVGQRSNLGSSSKVIAQLVDSATFSTTGTPFFVADGGFPFLVFEERGPDVGASAGPAGVFCVAWERESILTGDSTACTRTVSASGALGPIVQLDPRAGHRQRPVRISEGVGLASVAAHAVVFGEEDRTSGASRVRAATLEPDGTIRASSAVLNELGPLGEVTSLDVSSMVDVLFGTPVALAVYTTSGASQTVIGTTFDPDGSIIGSVDLVRAEHGPRGLDRSDPRVVSVPNAFVVGYQDAVVDVGVTRYLHYSSTVKPLGDGGLAVGERRVGTFNLRSFVGGPPAMASVAAAGGGPSSRVYMARCSTLTPSSPLLIRAVLFEASDAESPAWQYCDGEPNSTGSRGFLRMRGQRWASLPKDVVAMTLPPGQFALLVCGTTAADVLGPGGSAGRLCLGGTLGRFNGQLTPTTPEGVAEFDLDPSQVPLGGALFTATAGMVLNFQVWHRDQRNGIQTSNFTNAVSIRFL